MNDKLYATKDLKKMRGSQGTGQLVRNTKFIILITIKVLDCKGGGEGGNKTKDE